jgi:putative ABC transport system permease protein
MQTVLQDLLYTLRQLRKSPGFTLLAVSVLALGIGANTAVFSVVNAVLLRPLQYRDADRIVTLASWWQKSGRHGQVSAPDFHDWHDQSTAFAAMAYFSGNEIPVTTGRYAEYAQSAEVTPEFFSVFQVAPASGRLFSEEETKPHSGGAAVISYSYWQSHFAGSPDVISKQLRMMDHTVTIVGVMPPLMRFPGRTDIWIPANTISRENESRSGHNYRVVGRLRPGVTVQQAQTEMSAIGARLEKQYPDSNEGKSVAVTPMRDDMVRGVRLTLYLLLGAVATVLLIACANMANVLLAKASARAREMAIRAAVGARRSRIIRQLITESLVLSLVAGVAALVVADWAAHALVALAPAGVPRIGETAVDGQVLAFTLLVSLVTSLLFGLAPAVQLSRVELYDALKPGAGRGIGGAGSRTMRSILVVAQVSLSVVLLAGAGLLIRSFVALHNVQLGFRPENLLIMDSNVPASGNYPPSPEELKSLEHATRVYKDLLSQVRALPGVISAGGVRVPPGDVRSTGGYWIDHLPQQLNVSAPQAVLSVVTPGAFATLGMPVLRGRDFHDGDTYDAPFTAVINQSLARDAFAGQDPIGREIFCGLDSLKGMRIVGVVGDIRQHGPGQEPSPEIYMPYEQHPLVSTGMNLLVRTAAPPGTLEDVLQGTMRTLAPDAPVRFSTMELELSENVAAPRFRTFLVGIFAGLAFCLAMVGVYGVVSYTVSQSTNEIGVRMALGASRGNVLRLVLAQALTLSGTGLIVGLLAALGLTRSMSSMLFMVKPTDPATLFAVALLLMVVAVAAGYIPARRATKVDPMIAMRYE